MTSLCPYCRKNPSAAKPIWPFCSERCKVADLGSWAKEEYRIPGKPVELGQEESGTFDSSNDEE